MDSIFYRNPSRTGCHQSLHVAFIPLAQGPRSTFERKGKGEGEIGFGVNHESLRGEGRGERFRRKLHR